MGANPGPGRYRTALAEVVILNLAHGREAKGDGDGRAWVAVHRQGVGADDHEPYAAGDKRSEEIMVVLIAAKGDDPRRHPRSIARQLARSYAGQRHTSSGHGRFSHSMRGRRCVTIDRPLEEVYAFATDHRNDVHWRTGVESLEQDGAGAATVGTQMTEVMRFMGRRTVTCSRALP